MGAFSTDMLTLRPSLQISCVVENAIECFTCRHLSATVLCGITTSVHSDRGFDPIDLNREPTWKARLVRESSTSWRDPVVSRSLHRQSRHPLHRCVEQQHQRPFQRQRAFFRSLSPSPLPISVLSFLSSICDQNAFRCCSIPVSVSMAYWCDEDRIIRGACVCLIPFSIWRPDLYRGVPGWVK